MLPAVMHGALDLKPVVRGVKRPNSSLDWMPVSRQFNEIKPKPINIRAHLESQSFWNEHAQATVVQKGRTIARHLLICGAVEMSADLVGYALPVGETMLTFPFCRIALDSEVEDLNFSVSPCRGEQCMGSTADACVGNDNSTALQDAMPNGEAGVAAVAKATKAGIRRNIAVTGSGLNLTSLKQIKPKGLLGRFCKLAHKFIWPAKSDRPFSVVLNGCV